MKSGTGVMGIMYRKLHDCLNATADKLSAATIGADS